MNRIIKFRAWDTTCDNLLEWEDISQSEYFCQALWGDFLIPLQYTGVQDGTPWSKATDMQRIGFTEESWTGVEIYEGDIVTWKVGSIKCIGVVQWGLGGWNKGIHFQNMQNLSSYMKSTRVIGNWYQHPELLNSKEYS